MPRAFRANRRGPSCLPIRRAATHASRPPRVGPARARSKAAGRSLCGESALTSDAIPVGVQAVVVGAGDGHRVPNVGAVQVGTRQVPDFRASIPAPARARKPEAPARRPAPARLRSPPARGLRVRPPSRPAPLSPWLVRPRLVKSASRVSMSFTVATSSSYEAWASAAPCSARSSSVSAVSARSSASVRESCISMNSADSVGSACAVAPIPKPTTNPTPHRQQQAPPPRLQCSIRRRHHLGLRRWRRRLDRFGH